MKIPVFLHWCNLAISLGGPLFIVYPVHSGQVEKRTTPDVLASNKMLIAFKLMLAQ